MHRDVPSESLCVSIRGQTNICWGCVGVVLGVCYGPPDWEEAADEDFLRKLEDVLCAQTLVLWGT